MEAFLLSASLSKTKIVWRREGGVELRSTGQPGAAVPTLACIFQSSRATIILLSRFSLPRTSLTRRIGICCNVCATQRARW